VLTTWPNKETKAVYSPLSMGTACRTNDGNAYLDPGASCVIHFSADAGSPAGNQAIQIKGDNTEAITVNVNVFQ